MEEPNIGSIYKRWLKNLGPKRTALIIFASLTVLLAGGGTIFATLYGGSSTLSSSSDIELQRGLVGWWKMNGNAKDSSPYANNGTVTGATLASDRKSAANSSYSFSGTDKIDAGNGSSLNITGSSAVSAWFKFTSTPSYSFIISKSQGGVNGYEMFQTASGKIRFSIGDASGATADPYFDIITPTTYNDGNWHHAVGVYNKGVKAYIYIDGSLAVTSSNNPSASVLTSSSDLLIGARGTGGSLPFFGPLDDVRVYNRALSTSEVSALYKEYDAQLNAASGEKGLVGWWKMDGNAKDSSPYANNGTVTGATLTTDRKAVSNNAYSFDGTTGNSIAIPNIGVSSGSFTISGWVNTVTTGDYRTFVGFDFTHRILISNSGQLLTQFGGNFFSTNTVPNGSWTHITYVYDSSSNLEYFYINGSYDSQHTPSATPTWNSAFKIGQFNLVNYPYKGSIDDVRVYKRALSATEISNQYKSYNSQVNLYRSTPTNGLGQNLVGDWAFNGNAKDSTPYANNGTVNGATLTTDREGLSNKAYSFSGSNQYIDLGTPTILNLPVFSVSVWWKATSIQGWAGPVNNRLSGQRGFQLVNENSSTTTYKPHLVITNGTSELANLKGTVSFNIPFTAWHHFVWTYDGATAALYVDGVADTVSTSSINSYPGTGAWISRTYSYANGSIDDVRIWSRVLSATEVSELYNTYR